MDDVLSKIVSVILRVRKWFTEGGRSVIQWVLWLVQRALTWLDQAFGRGTPTDASTQTPTNDSAHEAPRPVAPQTPVKAEARESSTSPTVQPAAPQQVRESVAPAATKPPAPSSRSVEAPSSAATPPALTATPQPTAEDSSDETALARVMASEGRTPADKLVIGWSALQSANARKKSLFQLLTRSKGYGPKDRRAQGDGVMYASTQATPGDEDRLLARGILSGEVKPSAAIRAHKPRRWVERGQGMTDEQIVTAQWQWTEGIYGRIAGTQYILFGHDQRKLGGKPGMNAKKLLDTVSEVPATDAATLRSAA